MSYNSLTGTIGRGIFDKMPNFRELYLNNNLLEGDIEFMEDLVDDMEVIYFPENAFSGINN